MKTSLAVAVILSALVVMAMTETDQHQPCKGSIEGCPACTTPGENPFCHAGECHCHADFECKESTDCMMCANSTTPATCDGNHCHGPRCSHL